MKVPSLPKSSESHVYQAGEKLKDEHCYLLMIRYELF